jgi:hypothetical protein
MNSVTILEYAIFLGLGKWMACGGVGLCCIVGLLVESCTWE